MTDQELKDVAEINRHAETTAAERWLISESPCVNRRVKCLRCGHEWDCRKADVPVVCASCHSPWWKTARRAKKPE